MLGLRERLPPGVGDVMRDPLYKVQARALNSDAAAEEAADRYVEMPKRSWYSDRYKRQLRAAYLRGLREERNPWAHRGGNFAEPLRDAYSEGYTLRIELLRIQRGATS